MHSQSQRGFKVRSSQSAESCFDCSHCDFIKDGYGERMLVCRLSECETSFDGFCGEYQNENSVVCDQVRINVVA